MASINREQMEILVSLQNIQTESNRINKFLSGVDQQKEDLDKQVRDFRKGVEEVETSYADSKNENSDLEFELKSVQERIEKSEQTLKAVKTNKEYQVLLREIDENKKKIGVIEESLLKIMEDLESREKAVADYANDLSLLESKIEADKAKIDKGCVSDRRKLSGFEKKLDKIGADLDPKLLALFKQIAERYNGIAVTAVVDGVCTFCNINLPPQMYIELQRGNELFYCHQCQRIIYHKPSEAKPE